MEARFWPSIGSGSSNRRKKKKKRWEEEEAKKSVLIVLNNVNDLTAPGEVAMVPE